jgi:hypothetical protein
LFSKIGLNNNIVKGGAKTKIGGVKGIDDSTIKFYEKRGFIDGVKVCVRHSPLYGIEKQKVLKNAVELLKKYNRINTVPITFEEFKKLL